MKKFYFIFLLAFTSCIVASPRVISDIYPIQQIANAMTGEITDVIVDSPISPHNYKIKPSDIQRIEKADLIVRVSGQFVPNVSRYVRADDKRLLDLLRVEGLIRLKGDHHDHGHNHDHHAESGKHEEMEIDKHIWLSPDNAKVIAGAIAKHLIALDPEHKRMYENNLKTFSLKIDAQKEKLTEQLARVKDKPFVVFHNAYQYFEKTFDIKQTAMVREDINKGIRTKSFVLLEKALKAYAHVCVFKEPQFRASVVEQLGLNENITVASLDPIGYNKENTGYFMILDNLANALVDCLSK